MNKRQKASVEAHHRNWPDCPRCTQFFVDDEKCAYEHSGLLEALQEAENALLDYVPKLEAKGAMLGYGRSVLVRIRQAIERATPSDPRRT